VRVVGLNRVVRDAEAASLTGFAQAPLELADEAHRAKRGDVAPHLQGDMTGEAGGEHRAQAPRLRRIRSGLPAGAGAMPTPAGGLPKVECELSRLSPHRPTCSPALVSDAVTPILNRAMF
jgi:hypothetical protein